MAVYDFHTHTFLSDGELSPMELIRRAFVRGYTAIGVTDHAGLVPRRDVIEVLAEECARASREWDIEAIPGVELTHVPRDLIDEAARRARDAGSQLVVVHGETLVEPVEEGTNLAAVSSPHVDILAHPGLLTEQEAQIAARNNVFIEVSTRRGHSLTNGHIVRTAASAGARLILDSDSHTPEDLLTAEMARQAAFGAGLVGDEVRVILEVNTQALLDKIRRRR